MPTPRQSQLVRAALVALAAIGVGGFLFAARDYAPSDDSFYPKCQSYQRLGIHCPGCGLTRAAHALLNGDFVQATAYHPLALVVLPLLAFFVGRAAWRVVVWPPRRVRRREYAPPTRLARAAPWLIAGAMVAFAVARNVPIYPLTLLAPHELRPTSR